MHVALLLGRTDLRAERVCGIFPIHFGGGGTDSRGHVIKGKYMLTDRINVGGALFLNKVDGFQGGLERDFTRVQLDVEFKFE